MSVKIKRSGSWETVATLKDVDETRNVGKRYTFTANLQQRTTMDWYTNEAIIDTSSLPDGIYILNTNFRMTGGGGNSCIGRLSSNGFLLGYAECLSMINGICDIVIEAPFVRNTKDNQGAQISVDRYCNAQSRLEAQTLTITLIKIS